MIWHIVASFIVSLAVSLWAASKAKTPNTGDRGGLEVNRFGTDKPIPIVYGTRKLNPIVVYQGVKDEVDSKTKNETYYAILVWCQGEVGSLHDLKFDDLPYRDFGDFNSDGQMVEHRLGTDGQTMPSWFYQQAPDDMSGMDFSGLCVSYVKLRMDREYKRYPQGRPDFTAVIDGKKVKNWDTGAVETTDNPVWNTLDYFMDTRGGLAVPEGEIDIPAMIDASRICDITVDSGQPQFTMNMIVDTDERLMNNAKDMLAGFRASPIEGYAGLRFEIDRQRDSQMHIEVKDLTSKLDTSKANINERYNQVIVKYADAADNWTEQEAVFPEENSALHQQWLTDDNDIPNVHEEELASVTSYEEAMQMAEVLARQSRSSETLTVSVNSRVGYPLELMDVVSIDSDTRGWEGRKFVVREITYGERDTKLSLVFHDETVFPWTAKPPKTYPKTTLPNPNEIGAPSSLTLTELSSNPDFWAELSWDSPDGYVTGYDVEAWQGGSRVFEYQTATESFLVQGVTAGDWEFRVRAVTPITVSDWSTLSITADVPTAPTEVVVESGNTYIILRPKASQVVYGLTYEYYFLGEDQYGEPDLRASGASTFQMSGLQPDTLYWFEVRAVTSLGVSEAITVSGTTTKDNSVILDLLDGAIGQEQLDQATKDTLDEMGKDLEVADQKLNDINLNLGDMSRDSEDLWKEVGGLASDYSNFRNEYERRMYEGETLTGLVIYKDEETGEIVNLAYNYTDETYTQAGIRIDGVEGQVEVQAERITDLSTETEEGFKKTDAAIQVNADAIKLRATYEEVNSAVAGAIEAITPAYSWQFNTTTDGWAGVTWNAGGTVTIASAASITGISFSADENTALRWSAKGNAGGGATISWNGGAQRLPLPANDVADAFESGSITLTAADGWSGEITSIEVETSGSVELDYLEVGKPSAQHQQLEGIEARTAVVEQELDPENARWSQYVTTQWYADNALTNTDVQQQIDGWDATWGVSATMTKLDENDTVTKANSAQTWVDGANSNITDVVVAYNAQEGGIDDQLAKAQTDISTAQSEIDALEGTITDTITSFTGDITTIIDDVEGSDFEAMMLAYQEFLASDDAQKEGVKLSFAENKLLAITDEQSSMAQQILNLSAATDNNAAQIKEINTAFSDEKSARATSERELKASIKEGDSETLSQANNYTKVAVGYYDDDGNWVDGVLAEDIRKLKVVTSDGQEASLTDLAQVFETEDGNLIARGGMTTDVNGKVTGFVSHNDGNKSAFDIIADYFRVGVTDEDGNFIPAFYLDQNSGQMVYRGQMVLGDGYEVQSEDDIRAQDGYTPIKGVDYFDGEKGDDGYTPQKGVDYFDGNDGQDGSDGSDGMPGAGWYSLTLRDGVFPEDSVATNDFHQFIGRMPVDGDHLTYVHSEQTMSSVKRWDGSAWVAPQAVVHGDMLVKGTMSGDRFVANTEIKAPVIKGGTGDFSGSLTVDGNSAFEATVAIGKNADYTMYLNGGYTGSTSYVQRVLRKSDGATRFGIKNNGQIYSAAGGDLHNLTIHSSCKINGTLTANQIVGDIVSAKAKSYGKTTSTSTSWTNFMTWSTKGSSSGKGRTLMFLGCRLEWTQKSGVGTYGSVRVLINGSVVYEDSASNGYKDSSTNYLIVPAVGKYIGTSAGTIEVQVRSGRDTGEWTRLDQTVVAQLITNGGEFY